MDQIQQEVQVQQEAREDIDIHSREEHPSVAIASPAEELPEKGEQQQQHQLHEEEEEERTVATDSFGDDNISSVPDVDQITNTTVPLFVLDLQVRDIYLYIYFFISIHILISISNLFVSFFSTLSLPVSRYYAY